MPLLVAVNAFVWRLDVINAVHLRIRRFFSGILLVFFSYYLLASLDAIVGFVQTRCAPRFTGRVLKRTPREHEIHSRS